MITRTFHPVGQGAFYTENHECAFLPNDSFFVVYDCGNWKNEKFAQKIIEDTAKNNRDIDILFISHFDYDHVSGLNILLMHCNIRRVVLPLLHSSEKLLLQRIYKTLGFAEIELLIRNAEQFFGNNTRVTYVLPGETDQAEDDAETNEPESYSDFVTSLTAIDVALCNWVYVPYNEKYSARNSELVKLIAKEGLSLNNILKDPHYCDSNRKKLKIIYDKLEGKINQNSMLVYSGPLTTVHSLKRHFHSYVYPIYYNMIDDRLERVACLYTGDTNLNNLNVKSIFCKYWPNVGTLQIPHHGDVKSFKTSVLEDEYYVCPYSYGTKNTYKHPSPLISTLLDTVRSHSVQITESEKHRYTETINC